VGRLARRAVQLARNFGGGPLSSAVVLGSRGLVVERPPYVPFILDWALVDHVTVAPVSSGGRELRVHCEPGAAARLMEADQDTPRVDEYSYPVACPDDVNALVVVRTDLLGAAEAQFLTDLERFARVAR
jgi:hypothetical protein